ncbi:hypothetical protein E1B28_009024 [Marasmius oreades]|uniref:Uncharacterized protein n=1 Tax=Marasmius oreades TaxID=181124 RepID=A0A9P7S054_9AGAR|nr:uncharacterized protein E1B28_009024 [Marasmius oreades]KAG7092693.1 hypothetical protein E1B28_009024 [Marasmius oreades]
MPGYRRTRVRSKIVTITQLHPIKSKSSSRLLTAPSCPPSLALGSESSSCRSQAGIEGVTNMPSLRRSMSSPSVRSSPYPSLSSGNVSSVRTGGNGHRRSSGSDIASRRVLADIEWWRVTVGQRDLDAEQELEDNNHTQDQVDPAVVQLGEGQVERTVTGLASSTALQFMSLSSEGFSISPIDEYGVLAIPPQTPPRRHSREGSASSLASTPEVFEGPIESLRLGIEDMGLNHPHSGQLSPTPTWSAGGTFDAPPSGRPRSQADLLTILHVDDLEDYADFTISPLSSLTPTMFN